MTRPHPYIKSSRDKNNHASTTTYNRTFPIKNVLAM